MMDIRKIWQGGNAAAERAKRILEALFLALSGAYLIYFFTLMTTLYPPYPLRLERTMIAAMAAVAALRLALIGPKQMGLWLGAAMAGIYAAIYWVDRYGFLLFLAVLTLGYVGVDYRRVLKTWLVAIGGALAVTVLAALAGGIENVVYYRDGLRSSWGICYPTDLASLVLFLLMMLWVTFRKLPDWAMLLLSAACVALISVVTLSRNSLICGVLFCGFIAWHWLESTAIVGHPRRRWISRGVEGFLTVAFGLFAALTFLMVFLYAKGLPIGLRLDDMLSGRLKQCQDGLRNYGIHPFGHPFDQIGNGFTVFPQLNVNFIDSSYMLILLRYGWVLLLVLGVLWGWTVRRALKCGDRRLALVMGLIAIHSMLEHHFTEVVYNILLAMPFAAYAVLPGGERERLERPRLTAGIIALVVAVAAAWLAGPWVLTRLRTLFQAKGYLGGGMGVLPLAAILLALLAWIIAALWAVYALASALLQRNRAWTRAVVTLMLCCGVAAGACATVNGAIDRAAEESTPILEADSAAMEIVMDSARNPVYSDVLPVVYQRRFDGIRNTALPLEDLSRHAGCTVLTTADAERNVFFQRGFMYAQISDAHAVYTADPSVIEALSAAGYGPSDCFNTVRHVDMDAVAALNELNYEESSGALLDGPGHSLASGAPMDLFDGLYTATYSLRLPEGADAVPGRICLLRISAFDGELLLNETPIDREQFDAEGWLAVPITFEVGYVPDVEFLAFAEDARQLWVEDISCVKVR